MSGPEIRIDQITGLRTILAPGRAERPDAFGGGSAGDAPQVGDDREGAGRERLESCPFCEGNEAKTPPEVWAARDGGGADTPGWGARAVPNLYPALGAEEPAEAASPAGAAGDAGAFSGAGDPLLASRRAGEGDLFATKPARGAHEVIVNSPGHATALSQLDGAEFAVAVAAWRTRIAAQRDAAYTQLIVNEGGSAGASLPHTHAQLYALPFVPVVVARERERYGAYRERTGGSDLHTDILVEEVRRGERLVAIDDEAALYCPWASRSPFELRVVPRAEEARFEESGAGTEMIRTALRLLAERFGGPPDLNLWVRTAPAGTEHFHWHVDVIPRLTVKASFELATGVDINTYPPERAAADLRELL